MAEVGDRHRTRVLLLGGTTEAAELARCLAADDRFEATLSLAGRTANPPASPIVTRVGGFGGVAGLTAYLREQKIDVVLDATHPFAAQMSVHAVDACKLAHVALIALERPRWKPFGGDAWTNFASVEDAVEVLPSEPMAIFSGLGRLSLAVLERAPQHRWVIRVIDPLVAAPALPQLIIIEARGPFNAHNDIQLFRDHAIKLVLAKNAGGSASYAKIEAARALSLPVFMIDRPHVAGRATLASVDEAWCELSAHHASSAKRGV